MELANPKNDQSSGRKIKTFEGLHGTGLVHHYYLRGNFGTKGSLNPQFL
jgi:hypothetical protein